MRRPLISTNLAISADGKISSHPPRPSGWTSAQDHQRLLDLRKNTDAILVGRGTLEADQMTMTVPGSERQPLRCVISAKGEFDFAHPVFHRPGGPIHLIVTGAGSAPAVDHGNYRFHHASLPDFLGNLAENFGVARLHCEGGGQLIKALAELDFIDEFHLTLAGHTLFGGRQAATATGIPGDFLPQALEFALSDCQQLSGTDELFLTYQRVRP
jgi:2,5-diamino-6-(ribosylamino)-4(3H)-pyrimidinone 5'-phosphate reductase